MSINLNNFASGPLLTKNTNYDTSVTQKLKSDSIHSDYVTDGTLILENGTLRGLSIPIDSSDAISKAYVQGVVPNGPSGAIQYNYKASFVGSPSLIYTGATSVASVSFNYGLHTTGGISTFTDGYLTFRENSISGLLNTNNEKYAVNKKYVDFQRNRNVINSVADISGTTYNASYVLNGTILRTILTDVSDLVPSAQSIINYFDSYFGSTTNTLSSASMSFQCQIINNSTTGSLTILENVGTTFDQNIGSSVIIYPSYIAKFTLVITDITTPTIVIYLDSLTNGVTYVNSLLNSTGFDTSVPFSVSNNLLIPGPITGSTSGSISTTTNYTVTDVNKGIILRNPTANSLDTLSDLRIQTSLVIQNYSSFNLTISDTLSAGLWTFTPTGSLLVPSGHSAFTFIGYTSTTTTNHLYVISNTNMNG